MLFLCSCLIFLFISLSFTYWSSRLWNWLVFFWLSFICFFLFCFGSCLAWSWIFFLLWLSFFLALVCYLLFVMMVMMFLFWLLSFCSFLFHCTQDRHKKTQVQRKENVLFFTLRFGHSTALAFGLFSQRFKVLLLLALALC